MEKKKIIKASSADVSLEKTQERLELLSTVEPFLDFDLAAMRHKLIDDMIVKKYRIELSSRLSNLQTNDQTNMLLDILAEVKAEIHYLKAAYVERTRYQEPKFEIKTPSIPKKLQPDVLDIDMRCELTGTGWWQIEEDGRWAGPENQASIQMPALGAGKYLLEISILAEIDSGIVDSMQTTLNRSPISLVRNGDGFPANYTAEVTIPESYKFPFWTLKFDFQRLLSPREMGFDDDRRLAIKVQRVRFTRSR